MADNRRQAARLKRTVAQLLLLLFSATAAASGPDDDAAVAYWTKERAILRLILMNMEKSGKAGQSPELAGKAWRELAGAEATLGNDSAALEALEKVRNYTPGEPWLYMRLFQAHMLAGRVADARAALQDMDRLLHARLERMAAEAAVPNRRNVALEWADHRTAWSSALVDVALALGHKAEAVRFAEQRCNYGRLYAVTAQADSTVLLPTIRRLQRNEQRLRDGKALEPDLAALSCTADGAHPSITALVARAKAGLAVRGPDIEARYGPAGFSPSSRRERLGLAILQLVLYDKPLEEQALQDMGADPDLREHLDVLCEAYFFQGMYYRYVALDETRARLWLERAAATPALGTYERILARAELGLPLADITTNMARGQP